MRILFTTLFLFCFSATTVLAGHVGLVTLKPKKDIHLTRWLFENDFDVTGISVKDGTVDVLVNAMPTSDHELHKHYDIAKVQMMAFDPAIDTRYHTSEEVEEVLHDYHQRFPQITELKSIGKSVKGKDIWAIKITDNPELDEVDEPAILFNSMHHAREIMSPEVSLDTIEYLLTNYGNIAKVTHWVDANEIWVVPMLNVDGNDIVWSRNIWQRKNANEVDLNRNYPYRWGACNGSSGNKNSQIYRGPYAGSEPETQTLMALVEEINPVFDISYHSYSELVLSPFGCTGHRPENIVTDIGQEVADRLPRDDGNGNYEAGIGWEVLYGTDGDDISWMLESHGVIAYVIELGTSFHPDYSLRDPTVKKLRAGWGHLLDRLDQSGVRGIVRGTTRLDDYEVAVTDEQGNTYVQPIKSDSSFHFVLNPGRYKVQLREIETESFIQSETIEVGSQRVNLTFG